MKLLVLIMSILYCLSSLVVANPLDSALEKVGGNIERSVDLQSQQISDKVTALAEKGMMWLISLLKSILWFVTEILSIIGVGWLMSYLCDRDSRKMVRILVVLCVISLAVSKLVNLTL